MKSSLSGISEKQLQSAMEAALLAAGGGGGGGGLTFPDLIVTGTGGYTIPVGFNAIVKANCENGQTFSVNGAIVLSSTDTTWSTKVASNSLRRASGNPTKYDGSNAFIGTTQASPLRPLDNFLPNYGTTPNIVAVDSNATARTRTSVAQSYSLTEGDTITGGRYLVELYAV